jgi:hypothetical protein
VAARSGLALKKSLQRPMQVAWLAILTLLTPSATQAQNGAADAASLASTYELGDASGDRKCAITLDAKPAGPGFAVVLDRAACTPLFGYLAQVAAWRPAPARGIYFVTDRNLIVAEFTEGVGGIYEALRERDGVYFLANLKFAESVATLAAVEVRGEWKLQRPNGSVLCRIVLLDEPAAEGRFVLKTAGPCDSAITAFGPVAWQIERNDVVLFSRKDERLRFGRNEEGVWARVPDRPNPLWMVRP